VSWNLRSVIVLWRFVHSNGSLDITVLRRQTDDSMNSFITEDASVIEESVAWRGQVLHKIWSTECVKLTLAAQEICVEPDKS